MDLSRVLVTMGVEATLFDWMAVHGYLCLALRHPETVGASRRYVVEFVQQLGERLVTEGLLTAEELADAEQLERQPSSGQLDPGLMDKILRSVRIEVRQPMRLRVSSFARNGSADFLDVEVNPGTDAAQLQKTLVTKAKRWGFEVGTRFVIERLE